MKRSHTILILIAVITLLNATYALAAVTLASFTAAGGDGQVLLEWETASEINNIGFYLWRSTSQTGDLIQLNNALLILSQAMGSVVGAYYSYTDGDVINDTTYYYWLDSVDTSGHPDRYGPISATPGGQPTATPTVTFTSQWTATPTATATATATRTPTTTPPPLPTATSIPTTPYPPLPTATSVPTTPYPPLPTATSPPRPTSTPASTPAETFTQTPMSLPTSTLATAEISSPTSTAAATKIATVTLSLTPPSDETPAGGSAELTVEASVELLRTPSPTGPPTLTPLAPTATPQPPVAAVTPTALSLSPGTPAPAATPVALPISRRPAGLGHLWLIGILLIALGAGMAWLAYSFIRRGR